MFLRWIQLGHALEGLCVSRKLLEFFDYAVLLNRIAFPPIVLQKGYQVLFSPIPY